MGNVDIVSSTWYCCCIVIVSSNFFFFFIFSYFFFKFPSYIPTPQKLLATQERKLHGTIKILGVFCVFLSVKIVQQLLPVVKMEQQG
jgi:hypothetical protein